MLVLLAVGLMLPLATGPVPTNDSHWINLVWSDQFTASLRAGEIWPRWLPLSHGGLGAPVFYFYGPIAFWIAGIFGLAGAGTWPSLMLAAATALLSSGLAMYFYLRHSSDRALLAAGFYMAAPYHLLDFAGRGALAEFTAMAMLPLLAIGVRRAARGRIVLLALSYAVLIMTHLPVALLTSLLLVPMLAWDEAKAGRVALAQIGAGLMIGLGLAAAYLVPALTLQSAVAMDRLSSLPYLHPSAWSLLDIDPGQSAGLTFIFAIAAAISVAAVAALVVERQRWAWFTLATALLALGAAPLLWRLPLLDRVQFPWRILTLAEFGVVVLAARIRVSNARLLLAAAPLAVLSILVLYASVNIGPAAHATAATRVNYLLRHHPDVTEYLPTHVGEPVAIQSDWALALAAHTPPEHQAGKITTLRLFAFPAWQTRCNGETVSNWAEPGTGLIQYAGHDCTTARIATLPERVGWSIAGLSLLLLTLHGRRRSLSAARWASIGPVLKSARDPIGR